MAIVRPLRLANEYLSSLCGFRVSPLRLGPNFPGCLAREPGRLEIPFVAPLANRAEAAPADRPGKLPTFDAFHGMMSVHGLYFGKKEI